jgi:hypothetical protein
MKNQEHNNDLDQLFNKAKAGKQGLDDFEKDAFAGFETLGSEEEAKNLKAALDARINDELFNKEEKNNPKIYWLAAAGLALVIGLSTLFIVNNNESISNGSNLAISDVQEKSEEKILPDSKPELKEQTVAPVQTEAATDNSPAKEIIQNKTTELKLEKEEPTNGVKTSDKGVTSRMIVPAVKRETPKDGLFESENEKKETDQTERRNDNVAMGTGSNNSTGYFKSLDDLAKNDKSKEKINGDQDFAATTASTKTNQNKQASEDAEVEVRDEITSNESRKKGKADGKNKDANVELDYKQPILANNNTNSGGKENAKTKSSRAKKTSHKQSSMAGPEDLKTYPGSPKTITQEVAGEVNAVPAEAETKPLETTYNNCYYNGGEPGLVKDVKEKLKAGNLDQKFDAILYVNEKKIVEKVEFTNAYELTAKQKEEIIKILKSLNKFNAPSTGKKESFPYKLLYRP